MLSDLGFSYFGVSGFLLDADSSEKKSSSKGMLPSCIRWFLVRTS